MARVSSSLPWLFPVDISSYPDEIIRVANEKSGEVLFSRFVLREKEGEKKRERKAYYKRENSKYLISGAIAIYPSTI